MINKGEDLLISLEIKVLNSVASSQIGPNSSTKSACIYDTHSNEEWFVSCVA